MKNIQSSIEFTLGKEVFFNADEGYVENEKTRPVFRLNDNLDDDDSLLLGKWLEKTINKELNKMNHAQMLTKADDKKYLNNSDSQVKTEKEKTEYIKNVASAFEMSEELIERTYIEYENRPRVMFLEMLVLLKSAREFARGELGELGEAYADRI